MKEIYWGDSIIKHGAEGATGGLVQRDGEAFYKITSYDQMLPFFMAVSSGSDHWMFVSSTGGLTCGRRSPENALFPYNTDDKIHDACSTTGPQTVLLVQKDDKTYLWKPFNQDVAVYGVQRNLYKNLPGNKLIFEEINYDLDLVFSYGWSNSDRYGFVKKSRLQNMDATDTRVEVLDGLRNLLPFGVRLRAQTESSTLLDAYKQAEMVPGMSTGIYTLTSILTDRAEPSEALKATVVWSAGLDKPKVLLSEDQVGAFCTGSPVNSESDMKGKRGAFYVQSSFLMPPDSQKSWYLMADVNQGPSELPVLLEDIRRGVSSEALELGVEAGTQRLLQLVGSSDGCQLSSDALVTARHFSNTLFNIMRGGTFYDEYTFPPDDFLGFVEIWNVPLRKKFEALITAQSKPITLNSIMAAVASTADADMERIALEYLPLIFSRRHGDPSRPWNHFSIDIRNEDGSDKLYYQGNWRDIFQNWEALAISFPQYIECFIAKFVNASTADGYNPYRISKNGIDWEVLDPKDPWSNIGYWGDHQVNYLVKLLELSHRYHPGKLSSLLTKEIFVFADVPYKLKGYDELRIDPRNTIEYDDVKAEAIARRVERIGSDGKLHTLADGSIYRVNLLEKLLVSVLTKIGNFVPGGGIWMNTQRPEWNDANNALVGDGLSMVTLCYLRRFLVLLADLLADDAVEEFTVSAEVRNLFAGIEAVLNKNRVMLSDSINAEQRKAFMDELGVLGEKYREAVYVGFCGEKPTLDKSKLNRFINLALEYFDHSISGSRRMDGLFHSYNLIHFENEGYEVEHLYEMLEGQVAVLSSGYLGPKDSLVLLDNLRESDIYRPDQNSYMLYPDRKQARFLEKNIIPGPLVEINHWIQKELASGSSHYVERDIHGKGHFKSRFRNAEELSAALKNDTEVSPHHAATLCEIYEAVFEHRQFTGRSGSMYKYEGLGCIYWHMVSKLLLASSEVIVSASQDSADKEVINQLFTHYEEIKDGLGMHKAPAEYGAFPVDPYSHTPGFAGVQQPGMTGQVKEDVITRFSELGVRVNNSQISFTPTMLKRDEFLSEPETWHYSVGGEEQSEMLESGCLAFSLCAVPVIYRLALVSTIHVFSANSDTDVIPGKNLGQAWSRALFEREKRIQKIIVDISEDELR